MFSNFSRKDVVFTIRNDVSTMGFLSEERIEYGGGVDCKKKIKKCVKIMNNLRLPGSIALCYLACPDAKEGVVIAWGF